MLRAYNLKKVLNRHCFTVQSPVNQQFTKLKVRVAHRSHVYITTRAQNLQARQAAWIHTVNAHRSPICGEQKYPSWNNTATADVKRVLPAKTGLPLKQGQALWHANEGVRQEYGLNIEWENREETN
jgi:hypothetical protein